MRQQRLNQWKEIESISQKMLDLAISNQSMLNLIDEEEKNNRLWHTIASLDLKRMELLERFFVEPVNKDEVSILSKNINHVLMLDKELTNISQLAQNKISQSFSKVGHQQRAAIAYGSVQTA